MNKVIILGNLGKDPEVKTLDNGNMVANFSVATTERYKDKNGEKKQVTEWHNVVLWGKTAEIAQKYLKKGDKVLIEGKNQTRSWDKDGEKRYTTEIVGEKLELISSENKTEGGGDTSELPF